MNKTINSEWGVKILRPKPITNHLFRVIDDSCGVSIRRDGLYACIPRNESVVFQYWDIGRGSCAIHKLPDWPNAYAPTIAVKSADVEEVFHLTINPKHDDTSRVKRRPLWPSPTCVDDVVAVNRDGEVELLRCDSIGWTLLESYRY